LDVLGCIFVKGYLLQYLLIAQADSSDPDIINNIRFLGRNQTMLIEVEQFQINCILFWSIVKTINSQLQNLMGININCGADGLENSLQIQMAQSELTSDFFWSVMLKVRSAYGSGQQL
jgi:hypothetical protein